MHRMVEVHIIKWQISLRGITPVLSILMTRNLYISW